MGAVIGGESPLSEPYLHLVGQVNSEIVLALVPNAEIQRIQYLGLIVVPEGHVSMTIHSNLFPVTISKQIWPHWVSGSEAIVENKVSIWCIPLHQLSDLPVVVSQEINIVRLKWLVHRLVSEQGWVRTEFSEEVLMVLHTELKMEVVDSAIFLRNWIVVT